MNNSRLISRMKEYIEELEAENARLKKELETSKQLIDLILQRFKGLAPIAAAFTKIRNK